MNLQSSAMTLQHMKVYDKAVNDVCSEIEQNLQQAEIFAKKVNELNENLALMKKLYLDM